MESSSVEDSVSTTLDDDDIDSEEENKSSSSSSVGGGEPCYLHADKVLKPFIHHIHYGLCNGSTPMANYLLRFFGHTIQKPNDLVGVALVLRGVEGAGRGIIVNAVGRLHGSSYVHLSHELASPFNGWMVGTTLVFGDEYTWRGYEDKLMVLITEPTIRIEKICQEAETRPNGIHLVLTCNHDWVAPKGPSARRFAVIDVSPKFVGDKAYFYRLSKSMEHPDFYALLHHYLVNLEGFDPQQLPRECIAALWDMKLRSFSPTQAWLHHVLDANDFGVGFAELSEDLGKFITFRKVLLFDTFVMWCKTSNLQHRTNQSVFFKDLKRIIPGLQELREGPGARPRLIEWPSLPESREAFEKYVQTPASIVWSMEPSSPLLSPPPSSSSSSSSSSSFF